jgi:choline dehydrogenase-like flavoprotein
VTTSLILGSGPAAAGAALALIADPSQRVVVLDIGHRLDPQRRDTVARLASEPVERWDDDDLAAIEAQPVDSGSRGLPQKQSYGSDYPFEDVGQLHGVAAENNANRSVISGAYGGLSNVWGSQVMPFTPATFTTWPVSFADMEPHYRDILDEIPFTAEEDDLAEHFPLISAASHLPPLAPRTESVLAAYARNRKALHHDGVTVGKARLAFKGSSCVRCGLCMTGCPYGLIYSAAHTFDRLRATNRVDYHDELIVVDVGQSGETPFVIARNLSDGTHHRFEADRIYVACGAVGTTRLALSGLGLYDEDVEMAESAQFVMPMLSMRPTPKVDARTEFTLNQFNMLVALDQDWLDVSQIHFYPHNHAVAEALPALLKTDFGRPVADHLLARLTIGLGYLPSWESPLMRIRITRPAGANDLPGVLVSGDEQSALDNWMFRRVAYRMLKAAPKLDLWPVMPMAFLSAPGKSYHFGGSLPHRVARADGPLTTDRVGRLRAWSRVHFVDASVFPTVPATTFTLTIMANAHRIATESMELSS